MPTRGPMPEHLRTYHLLQLGVRLSEIDDTPAVVLDELLDIHHIITDAKEDG